MPKVNSVTAITDEHVISDNGRELQLARTSSILSYMILAGGLATIGVAAYLVVVSYSSLPYWDGWIQIKYAAERPQPGVLDWLWSQYNEQRLLIPKLFLLTDLLWWTRQKFLLASVFTIQLLYLLALTWSMRVLGDWRGAMLRTGIGLAAFCLFCPSQWENLGWGMQTCYVLPGLFATLSFIGLVLYWTRSRTKYLVLCIAATLAASYTLSNGNLLWPLLVIAALVLRLGLGAVVSLLAAGTVSTALFLYNYIPPTYAISAGRTPIAVLRYLAVYFGCSWVPRGIRLAELIGIAGLVVVLLILYRLPSYIRRRQAFVVQMVLSLLFCLGTGFITALARIGFGISQAFSSRYQTFSLPFWCCLGLILLSLNASRESRRDILSVVTQAILLAIILVAGFLSPTPLSRARIRGISTQCGCHGFGNRRARFRSVTVDILGAGPATTAGTRHAPEQHLSIFSEKAAFLPGQAVDLSSKPHAA